MKMIKFFFIINLFIFSNAWSDGSFWSHCHKKNCPDRYCSPCQCADLGRYRNNCMSDKQFCEAFGNVGGR